MVTSADRLFRVAGGRRALWRVFAVLLVLPLLGSCYIPRDFLAEIRIAENGDYAMVYKGKLTWAPMVEQLKSGEMSPEEMEEKRKVLMRDLKRDSHFRKVTYVGRGTFDVHYERMGRFTGTRAVTFVRRGAELLSMELRLDGKLYVRAIPGTKLDQASRLRQLGVVPNGRLRVMTNAPVLAGNPQARKQGVPGYPGWAIYDWTISGLDQSPPQLVLRMMNPANLSVPEFGR